MYELWQLSIIVADRAQEECYNWVDNWLARLLFVFDFSPLVVIVWLTIVSLKTWDTFIVGMTLVTYVDAAVNVFFNYVVIQEVGPQGSHCIYTMYQNPAYNVEQVAVIYAMYICLGAIYRTWSVYWYTMVTVFVYSALLISNHIYRRVNDVDAVFLGVVIGCIDGVVGFFLFYWLVPKVARYMDTHRFFSLIGLRNFYFRKRRNPWCVLNDRYTSVSNNLQLQQQQQQQTTDKEGGDLESGIAPRTQQDKPLLNPAFDQTEADFFQLALQIWARQLQEYAGKSIATSRVGTWGVDLENSLVLTQEEKDFCETMVQAMPARTIVDAIDATTIQCMNAIQQNAVYATPLTLSADYIDMAPCPISNSSSSSSSAKHGDTDNHDYFMKDFM